MNFEGWRESRWEKEMVKGLALSVVLQFKKKTKSCLTCVNKNYVY
jgi:hypothetical protein